MVRTCFIAEWSSFIKKYEQKLPNMQNANNQDQIVPMEFRTIILEINREYEK